MKKIFTIIMLAALSLTAMAQQKKVAVYVTGEQSGVSKVLGDQLVTAFAKSGKYMAVERTTSFLAELNKEQGYQRSGAVSDKDIARLGEQFGVQYVCVADITDAFGEKYVTARLIDVSTAEIVNAHNVSGQMNSMNVCINMASEIATNLSKGSFAEQAEEAARVKAEEEKRKQEAAHQRYLEEKERKEGPIRRKFYAGYIQLGLFYATTTLASSTQWDLVKGYAKKCQIGGWNDWRFPTEDEVDWLRYCLEGGNTTYGDVVDYVMHNEWSQYVDYYQGRIWLKNGGWKGRNLGGSPDAKVILVRGHK